MTIRLEPDLAAFLREHREINWSEWVRQQLRREQARLARKSEPR